MFVVDSQRERVDAGIECLERFTANLRDFDREPDQIAIVFQLNKRDCPSAADIAALKESFRWRGPVSYVESVASTGKGVPEALDTLMGLMRDARC